MSETLLVISASAVLLVTMAFLVIRLGMLSTLVRELLAQQTRIMEEKHRDMLKDLHEGLAKQGDRLSEALGKTSEQLRSTVETRLDQITGHVTERLDEGFKQTNETFTSVMTRLATIDEAQKKIDSLTTNMVSLQELLGDKRSRGAYGEVQLEALVRNILPATAYAMQYTLGNGYRADCVLHLPPPTGMVAVDSKFPLENFHRMFDRHPDDASRVAAQKQFKADVKRHVDDIAGKYILPPETCDGAVMFVPAEAVFAEIHAYHADIVDYAMQKQVWIVSPTTLMAVLNTARAVLKDIETREQVHVIKHELARLGKDFVRFDERMKKLADHIRQANQDVEEVHVSSRKISQRFARIDAVELDVRQAESEVVLDSPMIDSEGSQSQGTASS
jgi:DNA recombination protein RmuC